MNLDRFVAIVEAYGASPARWPEAERAAAVAFLKTSSDAQRLADEAEALDGLLDMPETIAATRDLQDRILAAAPAARAGGNRPVAAPFFNWSRWIPAAAVACSLALGVVSGMQLPGLIGLDDESLALQVASSAMSSGTDGRDVYGGFE